MDRSIAINQSINQLMSGVHRGSTRVNKIRWNIKTSRS